MKNYLIIGVHPTPNGALHLGHISGPFLTLDIFNRCKKIQGHETFYITGTDSFESHVLSSAEKENLQPLALCKKNSERILRDLKGFDINIDCFVELHNEKYKKDYFLKCEDIINNITDSDNVYELKEEIPFEKNEKKALIGCWLSGVCPRCNSPAGSFFCEECGGHYQPEQLLGHTFDKTYNVEYRKCNALFIETSREDIYHALRDTKYTVKNLEKYLSSNDSFQTRLTSYDSYDDKLELTNNIPFTYTVGLTAFYLQCAEVFIKKMNSKTHPFSSQNTITVTAYGFDNISAYMTGMLPILRNLDFEKAIDIHFINRFMLLNGKKFSTSRNHALWAEFLIKNETIDTDLLRLFLAKYSPVDDEFDFNLQKITSEVNGFTTKWNSLITYTDEFKSYSFLNYIEELNSFQMLCSDEFFCIKKLANLAINHINNTEIAKCKATHFMILIILISPLMPKIFDKISNLINDFKNIKSLIKQEGIDVSSLKEDLRVFKFKNLEEDLNKIIGKK